MKRFVWYLLWGISGFYHCLNAQDILQKTNKSKIEVKIIEIGTDEIKYKNYNDLDGPVYVIYKRDVMSIQRENGEIIQFEKDVLELSESPNSHKRSAIMIDPFSPIARHLGLGYQRWIKPGLILEGKVGLIGLGIHFDKESQWMYDKKGAFITISNKMMFKQLTYSKGTRIVHPLAGTYFKPQISCSYFTYKNLEYFYPDYNNYHDPIPYEVTYKNFSAALSLTIGRQWLIADVLLLDIFVGAGYGFYNISSNSPYSSTIYESTPSVYFHSHAFIGNNNFPLCLTSGISLGILMK